MRLSASNKLLLARAIAKMGGDQTVVCCPDCKRWFTLATNSAWRQQWDEIDMPKDCPKCALPGSYKGRDGGTYWKYLDVDPR